ncbi:TonB family protein [Arenimonas composti]|uniref:TonB C-terminal domain-containing protein n=1 Tax=Arenimonas composti TR7-09 = DSM 18010 TaxID=1121013 RepID=A0A091C193_9GAMM|nr:TonB family protein [Arenimonas composti]KFN50385.1 hypothetical protein P873_06845 [Arenimonas composti TR7-09 = DSM 18010]
MTSTELLCELLEATLASSLAALAVLALRRPLRDFAGPGAAALAWAAVPLAVLAVWLPARAAGPGAAGTAGAITDAVFAPVIQGAGATSAGPWLLALWASGAAAGALVFALRQRRFLRGLRPIEGTPWLASPAGGPAVVGLLRPRIVLPADFRLRYDAGELTLVLAHECMHLRRGDLPAQALATVLRCLFWFNPLLVRAERRFREDIELACDAAVLRQNPRSRRRYGSAMLKTHLADVGLPLACHWQSGHSLKERIQMLERPLASSRRRRTAAVAVSVALIASAGLAWAAQPAAPAADATAGPAQIAADEDVLTAPAYPAAAVRDHISGQVLLEILVGEDGVPREVKVVSSSPEGVFDAAAVEAARNWRFNAGRNGAGGEKVEGWIRVPVRFEAEDQNAGSPGTT